MEGSTSDDTCTPFACEGGEQDVSTDALKDDIPSPPEDLRKQIQEFVLDDTEPEIQDTETSAGIDGVDTGSGTPIDKPSSTSANSKEEKVAHYFKKAVEKLQEAYVCDKNGKCKDALKLYKEGIQQLLFCRKYAVLSPESQEKLMTKMKEYLARAEKITLMLKESKHGESPFCDADPETVTLPACVSCERPTLKFSDVVGAEKLKQVLKERVLLPLKFPQLFKGNRRLYDSILLYGPPGVGKTMLVRALGGEADGMTFIRVSAYDFVSKYEDGEKLMKQLFKYANEHAPSLLVMDDFEAMSSDCGEETQTQRRVKTEFMVQFHDRGDTTHVVAVTLSPWTMHAALRRRFSPRIYLDLPSFEDRKEMFRKGLLQSNLVPTPEISEEDLGDFATRTEQFTGADISVVTREAIMIPVRDLQEAKFFKKIFVEEEEAELVQIVEKMTPCSHDDDDAEEKQWMEIEENKLFVRPISKDDVIQALEKSKPTVSEDDIARFQRFTEDFGLEI